MTKRSSHPDHQLTSQFFSHPWCWERLHFGDIFTSKVISWRFLDITLVPCEDTSTCFVCPKKPCHWKVETMRFQVTHPPSKKRGLQPAWFPQTSTGPWLSWDVFPQAQSKFFHPWVLALVAEIQQVRKDEEVMKGRWCSLGRECAIEPWGDGWNLIWSKDWWPSTRPKIQHHYKWCFVRGNSGWWLVTLPRI